MAKEADCGFMIWDGKSRGTMDNVINLVSDNKTVLLYLPKSNQQRVIISIQEMHDKFGEQFINEYLQCHGDCTEDDIRAVLDKLADNDEADKKHQRPVLVCSQTRGT